MNCKIAILAVLCTIAAVSAQTLEEQEASLSSTQDDVALLDSAEGSASREKRFLFKKKALGLGLGLGAGLGFVKGYKLGKLSNGLSSYGYGNNGYSGNGYHGGYGHGGWGHGSSYGHGGGYGGDYSHGGSYGHGGGYGHGDSSYYPAFQTQHYHHHTYQPHQTYGPPSYNDYYNNYYSQGQGLGSQGFNTQVDGYTYNRPNTYDASQGSVIQGHKSLTLGAQWSGGITKNNGASQWR